VVSGPKVKPVSASGTNTSRRRLHHHHHHHRRLRNLSCAY